MAVSSEPRGSRQAWPLVPTTETLLEFCCGNDDSRKGALSRRHQPLPTAPRIRRRSYGPTRPGPALPAGLIPRRFPQCPEPDPTSRAPSCSLSCESPSSITPHLLRRVAPPLCACGQQATTAATQYLEGIASLDQARGCICLTETGHGDSTWLSAFARSRCLINALSELPTLLHLENQGSEQGSGLPSFLHPSWLSLLPPCAAPHHP